MSRAIAMFVVLLIAVLPAAAATDVRTLDMPPAADAAAGHRHNCPDEQRTVACELRAIVAEAPLLARGPATLEATPREAAALRQGTGPAPEPGPPRAWG